MRLILDNVSKRDYQWLLSMAKALNFKVTTDLSSENVTLDSVDVLLNEDTSDIPTTDFMKSYGLTDSDVAEFRQRKIDYQSGKDKPVAWETIKEHYGLL
ncbi:hypothetical protein [Parapedobacter koreensis]|uniref:Addiction module component n=1 Tax=Parapedobacter koreensis TaxID=332977 RepID=A0A1H7MCV6_9SPHI|nr:hypothetical protein [Parapedobacter koreensis]SEL09136.1 hypothetical protein SAMN05421740_103467 [Parapedobacter koreensis]